MEYNNIINIDESININNKFKFKINNNQIILK